MYIQVCVLNICPKPAAEKHPANLTSWKIQATRSHIPRSYHTHCQGYQGSTLMSKHWVDIRICEPDTRAGWYLLKSIWCSLVTLGRGKTSRAMKLDMERNLVGMHFFFFLTRRQMKANRERMIPEHNRHCINPRQATCILELKTRGPVCYSVALGKTLPLASWDYRNELEKPHSNRFAIMQTAEMLLQHMIILKTWS